MTRSVKLKRRNWWVMFAAQRGRRLHMMPDGSMGLHVLDDDYGYVLLEMMGLFARKR